MLTWFASARRLRRGFTLIEMLIVITVIALLAMMVIPRMLAAQRRAKEAQLRADLKQIRDAVERFESTTGAWPPSLGDVIAQSGAAISADLDGRGGGVDRSAYDGPYMVKGAGSPLPSDPFTEAANWNYDNASGAVHSTSALAALDGTQYNTW
jgi:prepilin-type N-terminal cleavage/methylation domain-containing protein